MKIITPAAVVFLLLSQISCRELGIVRDDGGGFRATLDFPLLPVELPLFPTELSMDGTASSFQSYLEDNGAGIAASYLEGSIESGVAKIGDLLAEASLSILNPGVLSTEVGERSQALFEQVNFIKEVSLEFEFENNTGDLSAVPTLFQMYMGEETAVSDRAEDTLLKFEPVDEEGETLELLDDDTVLAIKPNEVRKLKVSGLERILTQLADGKKIGLSFANSYRMADTNNGSDVDSHASEFGKCVGGLALKGTLGETFTPSSWSPSRACPKPSELLAWHTKIRQVRLKLDMIKDLEDLVELVDCEGLAEKYNQELLADACGLK